MFFLVKQFFARQECNSFQAAVSLRSYHPSWLITSLSVIFFFFKKSFVWLLICRSTLFSFLVLTWTQIYHLPSKKFVLKQIIETFLHHLKATEKPYTGNQQCDQN